MKPTAEHDKRMAEMTFSIVCPHYVTKVVHRGRTKTEFLEVINWFTVFQQYENRQLQFLL